MSKRAQKTKQDVNQTSETTDITCVESKTFSNADLMELPLSESTVFKGLIFDVSRMQVKLPDSSVAQRDIVHHPGAVAVVALTDTGSICLVKQYRPSLDRITVEIPAGKLEIGEDPLVAAQRELLEETGITAQRMALLTTIASAVGFSDELVHIYMATGLTQGTPQPDQGEFVHTEFVPLNEFINTVLDGRIEDAKTVVGALICDAVSHRLTSQNTVE